MTIRRTLLAGIAAAATLVVAPAAASASATDPYVDDTTPYEGCEFDPSIPADSPDCSLPCQYDQSIPADDPYCEAPPTTEPSTTEPATTEPTTPPTTEPSTTEPTTAPSTDPTTTDPGATTSSVVAAPAAPADPPAVLGQSGRLPASDPQLPATGSDQTLATTLIALAFVAGGGALVAATRRKQNA